MNVTIIGTGNMGRSLGYRFVAGGHTVTLVGRNLEHTETLAAELRAGLTGDVRVQTTSLDAINDPIIVLALMYPVALEIVKHYGAHWSGKTILDVTIPLNETYDALVIDQNTSAAEEIAHLLPADTTVVKAFNTVFATSLQTGKAGGSPLEVLLAGDSVQAKQTVAQLIQDGGMIPVDAGVLHHAHQLEELMLLGILLNFRQKLGFAAWKLVR